MSADRKTDTVSPEAGPTFDSEQRAITGVSSVLSMAEVLPYRVELWDRGRVAVERVLGRAGGASVARAIFLAARTEYPDRYVVLRRGPRIISEANQR